MKILYINSVQYDHLTATLVEGLTDLGHSVWCTENSNYGQRLPGENYDAYAQEADLIIVGSNQGVRRFLAYDWHHPRMVYVDGSDYPTLETIDGLRFKMVFKRELSLHYPDAPADFIFPLPFAAEKRYFPTQMGNKNILLAFMASMRTNPWRYAIYQRLLNLKDSRIVVGHTGERAYRVDQPLPSPQHAPNYFNYLQRSLMAINVAGAGFDCARYWEILANESMLFSQTLAIHIPDGFTDGVDCVTFASLAEFDDKLFYYMNRLDLVSAIAKRGHQRLLHAHTTKARAEYFLRLVERHVNREGYCERFTRA